jgi:hypothetical protein
MTAKTEQSKHMLGTASESPEIASSLREVLLGYLQAAPSVTAWPGGDGLTLEIILDFYPEAVAEGEVPDWKELLYRHPEFATELQTWMAAKDRWQFAWRRCAELRVADPKDTRARRQERDT